LKPTKAIIKFQKEQIQKKAKTLKEYKGYCPLLWAASQEAACGL
jgi:hypothetical protein